MKIGTEVHITSGEHEGMTGEIRGFVLEKEQPCALLDMFCNQACYETVSVDLLEKVL